MIWLDILQPLQVWVGDLLRMKVENAKETKALHTMTMRLQVLQVQSDQCWWLPWSSGTVFFSGYFVCGLEQVVNRKETVDVADLNVGHRGQYTTVCLQCKMNAF